MYFKNPKETPINDSLRDDMLYRINRSDPWYADIVNFMVSGYVPPGANKKKLIQEVVHIYEMSHTSSEYALMAYSGDV